MSLSDAIEKVTRRQAACLNGEHEPQNFMPESTSGGYTVSFLACMGTFSICKHCRCYYNPNPPNVSPFENPP